MNSVQDDTVGISPSVAGRQAAQLGWKREDNPYSAKLTPDKHARWDNAFVAEHVRMQRERDAMGKDPVGWLDYVVGTNSDRHHAIFVTIGTLADIRDKIEDLLKENELKRLRKADDVRAMEAEDARPRADDSGLLRREEEAPRGEREGLAAEGNTGEGDDRAAGADLSSLDSEAGSGSPGL